MLFDLLDNLEWYLKLHPSVRVVIDIMDRSLPYEDAVGQHLVDGLNYQVLSYVTEAEGRIETAEMDQVHIMLEGEELFSLQAEHGPSVVFKSGVGTFIHVRMGESYRHRQILTSPMMAKKVIFKLTEPVS